jgi:uncharacterized protein
VDFSIANIMEPRPITVKELWKLLEEEKAKDTILYIHGFKSSGNSNKAQILRKHFNVIAPDLPVSPMLSFETLREIIVNDKPQFIVGSSLGGFYALVLASELEVPTLLINPSVYPSESLKDQIGEHERFGSGEEFTFTAQDLNELKELEGWWKLEDSFNRNLFLAMDDELLDSKKTFNLFEKHCNSIKSFVDGGHQFSQFESTIPIIKELIL